MRDLELPELPGAIPDDYSVASLGRRGTMSKRLPSMPGHSVEKFFMSSNGAEEAAAIAHAIGVAYGEDKRRAIVMRAKARAAARLAQRIAEGRV
jgi:hypothetical protein